MIFSNPRFVPTQPHMNRQWLPMQHAHRLGSRLAQKTEPFHLAANQIQALLFTVLIFLKFSAMKISATLLLFGLSSSVLGQSTPDVGTVTTSDGMTCPTLPGTSVRDHSKPCTKREGNESFLTLPGTSVRDHSQPGWVHEGDKSHPTLPGTSVRDYSQSSLVREGDFIYPTLPGTSVRDYQAPGFIVVGSMMYPTLPGTKVRDYSKPGVKIED